MRWPIRQDQHRWWAWYPVGHWVWREHVERRIVGSGGDHYGYWEWRDVEK